MTDLVPAPTPERSRKAISRGASSRRVSRVSGRALGGGGGRRRDVRQLSTTEAYRARQQRKAQLFQKQRPGGGGGMARSPSFRGRGNRGNRRGSRIISRSPSGASMLRARATPPRGSPEARARRQRRREERRGQAGRRRDEARARADARGPVGVLRSVLRDTLESVRCHHHIPPGHRVKHRLLALHSRDECSTR